MKVERRIIKQIIYASLTALFVIFVRMTCGHGDIEKKTLLSHKMARDTSLQVERAPRRGLLAAAGCNRWNVWRGSIQSLLILIYYRF